MTVIWSQCRTVRLLHSAAHACDQLRLKIVKLGMIIFFLYLCSITSRSTAWEPYAACSRIGDSDDLAYHVAKVRCSIPPT